MKLTIKDIAILAGVSKSTVSKVMNDSQEIPESTKEKIRKIINEHDFIPDGNARNLATNKSQTVTVVIDTRREDFYTDSFFYQILGGAEKSLFQKNYAITLCNISSMESIEPLLKRFVLNKKTDGIIMPASVCTDTFAARLHQAKIPFVLIGISRGEFPASMVDTDNESGSILAVHHLFDGGYRDIAYIGDNQNGFITRQRISGYIHALEQRDIPLNPELIVLPGEGINGGYRAMSSLLNMKTLPGAVVCEDNYYAFGALKALKEKGICIPADMGLVTFNSQPFAPFLDPPLTSVEMDTYELGFLAAETLLQIFNRKDHLHETTLITPRLVIRESSVRNTH